MENEDFEGGRFLEFKTNIGINKVAADMAVVNVLERINHLNPATVKAIAFSVITTDDTDNEVMFVGPLAEIVDAIKGIHYAMEQSLQKMEQEKTS